MKCIVVKPSHFQGFLCNFKIEGDISISLLKKWSWSPCMCNLPLVTVKVYFFRCFNYDAEGISTEYEMVDTIDMTES